MKKMTPQDVRKLQHSDDALLLDVRTPAEIRQSELEACKRVPHEKVGACPDLDQLPRDREIITICASGKRATMAAQTLEEKGFTNLSVMEGGVNQWKSEGLPVKEGKGVMSLERQVRIAAGTLVAIGAALAYFVNPAWILLPGFVGCGLVFAGITDTCGMGMMIAKMPWNQ